MTSIQDHTPTLLAIRSAVRKHTDLVVPHTDDLTAVTLMIPGPAEIEVNHDSMRFSEFGELLPELPYNPAEDPLVQSDIEEEIERWIQEQAFPTRILLTAAYTVMFDPDWVQEMHEHSWALVQHYLTTRIDALPNLVYLVQFSAPTEAEGWLYLRMLHALVQERNVQALTFDEIDPNDMKAIAEIIAHISQGMTQFRYISDAGRWAWWTGSAWDTSGRELVVRGRFGAWLQEEATRIEAEIEDPEARAAMEDLQKRLRSTNGSINRTTDKSDDNPKYMTHVANRQVLQTTLEAMQEANGRDSHLASIAAAYRKYVPDNKQTARLLDQLAGVPSMQIRADDFDRHLHTIAAKDCIIDLRLLIPRAPQSSDLVTKTAAVNYVSRARCPYFLAFLEQAVPDPDERECLQRCLGYSITGEVELRRLFVIHGPTGSGKSTLLDLVSDILNDYALAEIPLSVVTVQNQAQHPTDMASLEGVRFGIVPEVSMEKRLATARIKLLTGGGDKVSARRMREDFYTFTPRVKVWFTGNEPPNIREQGSAVTDRFVVFPFRHSFAPGQPGHDPMLKTKLDRERAGIFLWLIEGAHKWYRDGASVEALRIPISLDMARDEYMQSADESGDFFTNWVYINNEKNTPKTKLEWQLSSDVYAVYCRWSEEEGVRNTWTRRQVTEMMKNRGAMLRKSNGHSYLSVQFLEPAQRALYDAQANGLALPMKLDTP